MSLKPNQQLFGRETPARSTNNTSWLARNIFLLVTLAGVLLGTALGLWLRMYNPSQDIILVISYPGELFMRVLKLMILPFVISCLIIGTATLNVKENGSIALKAIVYFILTSMLNVLLGIVLATSIHPGSPVIRSASLIAQQEMTKTNLLDGFLDMGRNLVPDNIFQAAFEQTFTEYITVTSTSIESKNSSTNVTSQSRLIFPKRQLQYRSGTNTLGIIFFFLIFGSVLGTLGPQKEAVINFFRVVYEVLMKMLMGAIWFTPLGVGSVICGKIITIDQLGDTLAQLSWFIFTMAVGVLIYQLVLIQIIYFLVIKRNPYQYYLCFGPSLVTAFATASKSAAMPITFRIMEEKAKIDKRIAQFILPIGTINMDGTALFLTVSLIFIAQMNNIPLGVGELLSIGLSCTIASMSSATVPSAALVLVLMLCSTINAPTEDVSLLFAVDWFVDRMRTTNNLLGDCYACAIVQKLSKTELSKLPATSEESSFHQSNGFCVPENSETQQQTVIA